MAGAFYPVADFVQGLTVRGLAVRVVDGDLILTGPSEARTDRIRKYLRTQKLTLVEYLSNCCDSERSWTDDELIAYGRKIDEELALCVIEAAPGPAPEFASSQTDEDDDPGYGDRIRAAYRAASDGVMPKIRVVLSQGTSTDDPGDWLLRAVKRCRQQRKGALGSPLYAQYLDRTLNERIGIEAVADWWDEYKQETTDLI